MRQVLTGRGIGVAVLDSGIYPHVDFDDRIIAFKDIINNKTRLYDDNGHGTHVSGVIAGNGKDSGGEICGMAPEANIIAVKILSSKGQGNSEDAIAGIEWILSKKDEHGIRVANISLGTSKNVSDTEDSALIKAVEKMWDAGIVVVAAAGNNGPKEDTITSPGISRKIITVGAYDEMLIKTKGKIKKYYSGRGPVKGNVIKPEIVARGSLVMGCRNRKYGYTAKSGTSVAAPYVSGMIARLLQKYPDMTPQDVKVRLYDRAIDLGLPKNVQGWGIIDNSLF